MAVNYESRFVPYRAGRRAGKGAALVFAPHPDDEVIGCGGAVLRHLEDNEPVKVIIVTDGRLGNPDLVRKIMGQQADPDEIAAFIALRREESCAAGKKMGYGPPEFWNVADRQLKYGTQMIERVRTEIEMVQPAAVYSPSIYEMHPDHRTLARIVLNAVLQMDEKPDIFMYEIGRPMPSPDLLVDISRAWDRKIAGIECFKSQLAVCPFDQYTHALNYFRTFTLPPEVKMAEAYLTVSGTEAGSKLQALLQAEAADRGEQPSADKETAVGKMLKRFFTGKV